MYTYAKNRYQMPRSCVSVRKLSVIDTQDQNNFVKNNYFFKYLLLKRSL